jgi:omega-6 fatty acid desaturase (delta-12 desaturase)
MPIVRPRSSASSSPADARELAAALAAAHAASPPDAAAGARAPVETSARRRNRTTSDRAHEDGDPRARARIHSARKGASPTLAHVLACMPPECYANPTRRGLLYFGRDLAIYGAVIALLAWTDAWLLLVPLWILAGLAISALFIVGHDAAHGSLFKSRRFNYIVGQAAMLPSLHLYEMWCYGHNRIHHGHTTREEMDYVWHPLTPAQFAAFTPMQKLAHKVKWSCAGSGLYYGWDIWWKRMILFAAPDKVRDKVVRDRFVVGAFFVASAAALALLGFHRYGTAAGALWMWVKVFGVPFLLWNYSIGIAVYIHHIAQDISWHGRRDWTKFAGQVEGTTILHIPAWLNFFYHNIFLHVPHHVDMRIPFYGLPAATDALRKHFGAYVRERRYRVCDYFATTRACKLFDFERGVWCGYDGRPVVVAHEV